MKKTIHKKWGKFPPDNGKEGWRGEKGQEKEEEGEETV